LVEKNERSKFEYRNLKQIRMAEILGMGARFRNPDFDIVLDFVLRISDFSIPLTEGKEAA